MSILLITQHSRGYPKELDDFPSGIFSMRFAKYVAKKNSNFMPSDKSAHLKIGFLISQPKHML